MTKLIAPPAKSLITNASPSPPQASQRSPSSAGTPKISTLRRSKLLTFYFWDMASMDCDDASLDRSANSPVRQPRLGVGAEPLEGCRETASHSRM